MFARLGALVHDFRRSVIALVAVSVVVAAVFGTSVFGSLVDGGFEDPDSESQRALAAVEQSLGRQDSDVLAVYRSDTVRVDDPAFEAAVTGVLDELPRTDVAQVTSFWSTGAPALVSEDGRSTVVALQLAGATEQERAEAYERVAEALEPPPGFEVLRGGPVPSEATSGRRSSRTSCAPS
jgi:RND superfamily putative drug exporter